MTSQQPFSFMEEIRPLIAIIEQTIGQIEGNEIIPLFYEPIRYVIDLPGKRLRPLLVLLSAGALGARLDQARYAAAAVELLHDFTLVHDDIMDNDDTRRGQPTVHVKWDVSTAILAGDGLMGLAFQKLLQTPVGDTAAMTRRLADTMIVICEGQALDKMFESESRVSSGQYLDMITRKTAALIELSCELGGMVAGATKEQSETLRSYGFALGMAFQIQDDLLDIIADEGKLGKKVGSDLAMHKQTILTIALREKVADLDIFKLPLADFRQLLFNSGVAAQVTELYQSYFQTAFEQLERLPDTDERQYLRSLTSYIRDRQW